MILILPADRSSGPLLAGAAFQIVILAFLPALLAALRTVLVLLLILVLRVVLLALALLPLPALTIALLALATLWALLLALLLALLAFLLIALLFVRHNVPPISLMIGARTQAPHAPHPAPIILQPAPTMTVPSRLRVGFPLSAALLRCRSRRILNVTPQ